MKRTASIAQESGKLASLPDKLPLSVEARVGKIDFRKGLPTQKGIEQLFEIQDFQRATQLYQWAIPAIGVMGWHKASIANGKTGETDWVIYDEYVPRQGILTPNTEVSYVMAFPDLEKTGPLVLDYAPGKIAGIVMDYWQRPQFDYGLNRSRKGRDRRQDSPPWAGTQEARRGRWLSRRAHADPVRVHRLPRPGPE